MKTRLIGAAAIAVLLGISATGCAKNSIVGKWSGATPLPGQRGSLNMTIEYKPDGTETTTINHGARVDAVFNEAYTVKNDIITETVSGLSIGGRTISVPGQTPKPQTSQFKLDGDTLKLTNTRTSQTMTLIRVKQ